MNSSEDYLKLKFDYGLLEKKNTDLEKQVLTLKAENAIYKLGYEQSKSQAEMFKAKYLNVYSYAVIAEHILINNGFDFQMVDEGLDYEALRGEN
jgi:hypothetical protein